MAEQQLKRQHAVTVELPDELVKRIASELAINDESRIPRTLTVMALPANLTEGLGRNTHIDVAVVA